MKKPATKTGTVQIRLLCVLSGDGQSWSPGDVIAVDAAEADRLVGLKAAELAAADGDTPAAEPKGESSPDPSEIAPAAAPEA